MAVRPDVVHAPTAGASRPARGSAGLLLGPLTLPVPCSGIDELERLVDRHAVDQDPVIASEATGGLHRARDRGSQQALRVVGSAPTQHCRHALVEAELVSLNVLHDQARLVVLVGWKQPDPHRAHAREPRRFCLKRSQPLVPDHACTDTNV